MAELLRRWGLNEDEIETLLHGGRLMARLNDELIDPESDVD
jgi:hypothetical protein